MSLGDDNAQTIVCSHFGCEKVLVLLGWCCFDHAHLHSTGLPTPAILDDELAELRYEMPQAERFRKLDELILDLIDHHEEPSERQLYRDLHNRIKQEESDHGP